MSEPTAEQVRAELNEASRLVALWHESKAAFFGDGTRDALSDVIATALARVRIEAHAAGRDEGLDAAAHLSETFDELVHMHDLPDAIRALRART